MQNESKGKWQASKQKQIMKFKAQKIQSAKKKIQSAKKIQSPKENQSPEN